MMTKIFFAILASLGLFATGSTLVGILMDGKFETFGVITALGYLMATLGFLFLVGWTYFKGHLNDVEAPKYKVLAAERDDRE